MLNPSILSILRKFYWCRNCYLPDKFKEEVFIVVTRIFQQTFLRNNRFSFAGHLAFIASILLAGCTAPAHLVQESVPTQDEKLQQTIGRWKGTHISKVVQKYGSPNEVNNNGIDWHTYVWQVPVQTFLAPQRHRILSRRYPNGLNGVSGTILQTDYTYELTFYTRPDGIISKTDIKKNYDPTSELNWK